MSRRTATWLAWSMCALSLTLTALSLLISALNLSHLEAHVYSYWLGNAVLAVSSSIIGAIIASRLPANPVGWLFCAAACIIAVAYISAEYAIYALLAQPHSLPDGDKPVQIIMFAFLFVAAVSTLGLRLRRSRGIEHQQIKWPAYTAVIAAGSSFLEYTVSDAMGLRWLEWAGYVVSLAALVCFPISIGIAIVRYRLYEIDTLINRTLVYALLTAILAAVYFGAVVLLQRVFVALTGQQSTLAVVASTLVIAALFTPLRRRIQSFIDRRFYRSKYDAAKPLEGFSLKLRDETDLRALSDDLVSVVRETMQPAHVSLWLRPETTQKGEQTD